MSQNMILPQFK